MSLDACRPAVLVGSLVVVWQSVDARRRPQTTCSSPMPSAGSHRQARSLGGDHLHSSSCRAWLLLQVPRSQDDPWRWMGPTHGLGEEPCQFTLVRLPVAATAPTPNSATRSPSRPRPEEQPHARWGYSSLNWYKSLCVVRFGRELKAQPWQVHRLTSHIVLPKQTPSHSALGASARIKRGRIME